VEFEQLTHLDIFVKMKHLFSIASKDEKEGEVAEVTCDDL
jgi:hypothetical protein